MVERCIDQFANWPSIYFLIASFIVCAILFTVRRLLIKEVLLDTKRQWYTPVDVQNCLESLSPRQRVWYAISELTVDVAFPFTYAILAALMISTLLDRLVLAWGWLLYLPLITAFFDLLENFSIVYLISTFKEGADPRPIAYVTCISSFLKWKSGYLILLTLAVLGLFWIF